MALLLLFRRIDMVGADWLVLVYYCLIRKRQTNCEGVGEAGFDA